MVLFQEVYFLISLLVWLVYLSQTIFAADSYLVAVIDSAMNLLAGSGTRPTKLNFKLFPVTDEASKSSSFFSFARIERKDNSHDGTTCPALT